MYGGSGIGGGGVWMGGGGGGGGRGMDGGDISYYLALEHFNDGHTGS